LIFISPGCVAGLWLTSLKNGNNGGSKKRVNSWTSRAQREDNIQRTVYVSDIDQQVRLPYRRFSLTVRRRLSICPNSCFWDHSRFPPRLTF
jgi:hypothetical protein